jgi:hypothetical protein
MILKVVYYPKTNILNGSLGNRPSQIWREIVEGKDIFGIGLIKRIDTSIVLRSRGTNGCHGTRGLGQ